MEIESTNIIPNPIPVKARKNTFWETVREPMFAHVLEHRVLSGVLAVLGIAQVATAWRHVTVVVCPMARVFGLPCPGCGLTRATVYFSAGHFGEAMRQHAFSPVVVAGILMMLVAAVGPRWVRERQCRAVAAVERRTGIVVLLFALMMAYWVVRLAVMPGTALEALRM